MPYSKVEFNAVKQEKYKAAVASAAGTNAAYVDILSITETRRRTASIIVETKIRAADETGLGKISESLGSGDGVKTKINTELKKQGLSEATASSTPKISSPAFESKGKSSNAGGIAGGIFGFLVVVALSGLAFCLWRKTKISKVAPVQGEIDQEIATVGMSLGEEREGQRESDQTYPTVGPTVLDVVQPENNGSNEVEGAELSDFQVIESSSDRITDGQSLHQAPGSEDQESTETTTER
jgi:hypothetical protein